MKMKYIIIPAFLFASCSAFTQVPVYEVYALRFTAMQATPLSYWAANTKGNKDSVMMCYMFWLIRAQNNKNILVDAGYLPDFADTNMTRYIRPDSMLLKLNIQPSSITDIILTHPHWDHIDGIDLFPNAVVWMQKQDFNYFVGTAWQDGGKHEAFSKRDVRKLIEKNLSGKLVLIDGDDRELFPGIRVFTGSKHTFESQYVLVSTNEKKVILASDNVWVYYNLEHLVSVPPYGTFDSTAYVQSMKRMKSMVTDSKYIIPGHDGKIFSVFPSVEEGIVRIL